MINQPTWDGDKFIALEPFGGYLLAVKERTIFEIRGTDPSSFTITEAYGTDGPVENGASAADQDEHAVPVAKRNRPVRRKHAAAAQPGRAI